MKKPINPINKIGESLHFVVTDQGRFLQGGFLIGWVKIGDQWTHKIGDVWWVGSMILTHITTEREREKKKT